MPQQCHRSSAKQCDRLLQLLVCTWLRQPRLEFYTGQNRSSRMPQQCHRSSAKPCENLLQLLACRWLHHPRLEFYNGQNYRPRMPQQCHRSSAKQCEKTCGNLCVGGTITQGWNSTLARIILPACHSSAIALQQNRMIISCGYLCVGGSITQGWNSTLAKIVPPACRWLHQPRLEFYTGQKHLPRMPQQCHCSSAKPCAQILRQLVCRWLH